VISDGASKLLLTTIGLGEAHCAILVGGFRQSESFGLGFEAAR